MHFLYLYTDYFQNHDIPLSLQKLGHTYDCIQDSFMTYEPDPRLTDLLETKLQHRHYDAVLNFGYVPYISDICQTYQIPYVSWTYDSILHSLYNRSLENDSNFLFVYDAAEYRYLQEHFRVPHLYHLPLAVNTDRVNTLFHGTRSVEDYQCDISFVGDLYQHNTYVDLEPVLTMAERQYFEQAFDYFHGRWGDDSIYDWFSKEDADYLQTRLPDYLHNDERLPNQRYFADILLSKPIGSRERIDMLNLLAAAHDIRLYTKPSADTSVLTGVDCRSYLNYYDEMYYAFYNSRINLNITLHGMMSGVPLRCFDIMGAGGFLISNYQSEMGELFEIGRDLICYHSLEELTDLAAYYLSHESERATIATSGHRTIEAQHTYTHRIRHICSVLERETH